MWKFQIRDVVLIIELVLITGLVTVLVAPLGWQIADTILRQ